MAFSLRRRVRARALVPGRYLTDGRRLLRVVSKFDDGRSVMALLEDCFTLDAFAYALVELRSMGFRRVRVVPPVAADGPAPRTADQTADRPADQTAGRSSDQSGDRPVGRTADRPPGRTAGRPSGQAAGRPAGQGADQAAGQAAV